MSIKLIITGPARSGTSVLAKFINDMGFFTGGTWDKKIDAGMEHREVGLINQNLFNVFINKKLKKVSAREKKVLVDRIQDIGNEVIKQPRFIVHPEIIKFWHKATPGFKILITHRNFDHCVLSVKRVKNKESRWTAEELAMRWSVFIDTLFKLKIEHSIVSFPSFLNDYEKVYGNFKYLGINFEKKKGKEVWDKLIDLKKVHFK